MNIFKRVIWFCKKSPTKNYRALSFQGEEYFDEIERLKLSMGVPDYSERSSLYSALSTKLEKIGSVSTDGCSTADFEFDEEEEGNGFIWITTEIFHPLVLQSVQEFVKGYDENMAVEIITSHTHILVRSDKEPLICLINDEMDRDVFLKFCGRGQTIWI